MRALAWLPRVILGGTLGLGAFLWLAADPLGDARHFEFVVRVRATAPGMAQLFFDRGQGFSQADSSAAPLDQSPDPAERRLPIPPGRYRALRFDPGTAAGEYEIGTARIEDGTGRVVATFGPRAFEPTHDLAVLRRTETVLVVTTTAPQPDPQLLAVFGDPLLVAPPSTTMATLAALLLALAGAGTIAVAGIDRALLARAPKRTRAWLVGSGAAAHGVLIVSLASAAAGLLATYPLLLGRSVVAPSTGGSVMLYDRPPYVPGSLDFTVEDARQSDTGSTMWGILPYTKVQREALAAGEWPLWQRYSGLGRPLWGQGQSMFLDPLHLLSLAVEDPAAGWDLKLVYARVVFAVGAGLAALGATGSVFAGLAVGAAAPFIGYYTFRLNHPAAFSLTYIPWLLGAFVMLARQVTWTGLARWSAAAAAAGTLQMVAATPKEGAIAMLAGQTMGLLAVTLSSGSIGIRVRRTLAFGGAGLIALLLSAPHWLIFLDTLSRAWTVYDVPAVRLAEWPHLALLALGAVAPGPVWPGANMLVTVGLLMSIVASADRGHRMMACACWAPIVGCVAVALGAVPTPWLLEVPLLRNLYSVNTSFFGAAIPLMLLASSYGFAGLERMMSSRARAATLAVLTVALAARVFQWQGGPDALGGPAMMWVALTLGCAVLFPWSAWAWAGPAPTRVAGPAAVALGIVLLAPGGLHLETGIRQLDALLMQPRPRVALDGMSPAIRAARGISEEPFRAIGLENVFFAGTQALYGIEGVIGADAIELPHLRELGEAAGMFRHPWVWLSIFTADDMQRMSGLLDMFGVRVVFSPPEVSRSSWRALRTEPYDLVRVFARPTAWPRAFFVDGVGRYATAADLVARLQRATTPFAAVQDGDTAALRAISTLGPPRSDPIPAHGYSLTPNTTTFTVQATAPGIAVIAEAYEAEDFRATLNGAPVPYFRVDHMYKAVVIPTAGSWTVRFEYRPRLWTWSWSLAGAGLVLLIAFPIVASRLLD